MGLSARQRFVTAILMGRHESVGVQAPRLRPHQRASLAASLRAHGCPSWAGADVRAASDGLEVYEALLPGRCGASLGSRVYVPPGLPPEEVDLVIDHERVHARIKARGLVHATEADAWLATADITWPSGTARPLGFPHWFLDAVEIARDPWREAIIAKVMQWG